MKPFHTNLLAAKAIAGVGVHELHYIEPTMIVAQWLLEDVFS